MVLVKPKHAMAADRFCRVRPKRHAAVPAPQSLLSQGTGSAQKGHSALTCKLSRNRVEGSKCKVFA